MQYKYIDIHSHIQEKEYDLDRSEVLARMKEEGIGTIAIGVDKQTSANAIALAEREDHVFAGIGVHPNDNLKEVFDRDWFFEKAKHPKVVTIGECGLDYFRREKTKDEVERQEDRFRKQIELAVEVELPLMLHVREAHEDAIRILTEYKKEYEEKLFGNVHFFTSTSAIAKQYIDLGFTISFPGVVTFADEVAEAAKDISLDRMHVETDSPYATPVPFRGKRNEPMHVKEIVEKIAEVKQMKEEEVRERLLKNTKQLFKL